MHYMKRNRENICCPSCSFLVRMVCHVALCNLASSGSHPRLPNKYGKECFLVWVGLHSLEVGVGELAVVCNGVSFRVELYSAVCKGYISNAKTFQLVSLSACVATNNSKTIKVDHCNPEAL